jgi:hypothetical protein
MLLVYWLVLINLPDDVLDLCTFQLKMVKLLLVVSVVVLLAAGVDHPGQ